MKLHEVAAALPRTTTRTVDDVRRAAARSGERLGVGYYGSAYDRSSDISGVKKVARAGENNDLTNDGYVAFVERIMSKHNPYFPQVSELKKYKNKETGREFFTINIEKLVDLTKVDDRHLAVMYERITGEQFTDKMSKRKSMFGDDKMVRRQLPDLIASIVENAVYGDTSIASIVDPQLRDAIRILAGMRRQGWGVDMHEGNFMCRMTPYGAQLVITDPFTEKSAARKT
jgi:hypothetical protein